MEEEKIVLALGSPDDVPEEVLVRIQKWSFMWLHEHGFEGEMGEGHVNGMDCHFIAINKPDWTAREIQKFMRKFSDSLAEYLSENV